MTREEDLILVILIVDILIDLRPLRLQLLILPQLILMLSKLLLNCLL